MIVELQLHDGKLIAVGDMRAEDVPHVGDRLVIKDDAKFFKTHDVRVAHASGSRVAPIDLWYGRVRVCSRKFVYRHGWGLPPNLELTVEDLASSEAARGEADWSEPDPERATQAAIDVAERIKEEGSLNKATVRYLYETMRAAQSNLRRYSPLMLEIKEVLKRNGFDR